MCLSVASMVLSRPDANVLAASGACIAWPNLLSYLRGYRFCGALLRMMIEITREAGPFMLVMLVWTLGFSTGFYLLFADGLHDENSANYEGGWAVFSVFKVGCGC